VKTLRTLQMKSYALTAAILLCPSFTAAAPDLANKSPPSGGPSGTQLPAHVSCMRALEATLKLQSTAAQVIGRDDLAGLTQLYEDVDARLRAARADMDRAFLTGAWQTPAKRQRAAELLGQLEGVQMLNFIGLAFLKGYEHPTHKVSLSIRDANQKMFMQLGQLLTALDAFDTAGKDRSRADRGR
jgi:hypothetical protein